VDTEERKRKEKKIIKISAIAIVIICFITFCSIIVQYLPANNVVMQVEVPGNSRSWMMIRKEGLRDTFLQRSTITFRQAYTNNSLRRNVFTIPLISNVYLNGEYQRVAYQVIDKTVDSAGNLIVLREYVDIKTGGFTGIVYIDVFLNSWQNNPFFGVMRWIPQSLNFHGGRRITQRVEVEFDYIGGGASYKVERFTRIDFVYSEDNQHGYLRISGVGRELVNSNLVGRYWGIAKRYCHHQMVSNGNLVPLDANIGNAISFTRYADGLTDYLERIAPSETIRFGISTSLVFRTIFIVIAMALAILLLCLIFNVIKSEPKSELIIELEKSNYKPLLFASVILLLFDVLLYWTVTWDFRWIILFLLSITIVYIIYVLKQINHPTDENILYRYSTKKQLLMISTLSTLCIVFVISIAFSYFVYRRQLINNFSSRAINASSILESLLQNNLRHLGDIDLSTVDVLELVAIRDAMQREELFVTSTFLINPERDRLYSMGANIGSQLLFPNELRHFNRDNAAFYLSLLGEIGREDYITLNDRLGQRQTHFTFISHLRTNETILLETGFFYREIDRQVRNRAVGLFALLLVVVIAVRGILSLALAVLASLDKFAINLKDGMETSDITKEYENTIGSVGVIAKSIGERESKFVTKNKKLENKLVAIRQHLDLKIPTVFNKDGKYKNWTFETYPSPFADNKTTLIHKKKCFLLSVRLDKIIEKDINEQIKINNAILDIFQEQHDLFKMEHTILIPNNFKLELLIVYSITEKDKMFNVIAHVLKKLEFKILTRMSFFLHCTNIEVHMHKLESIREADDKTISQIKNTLLVVSDLNERMSQFIMKQPWGGTLILTEEAQSTFIDLDDRLNDELDNTMCAFRDKKDKENKLYLLGINNNKNSSEGKVFEECKNAIEDFGTVIRATIERRRISETHNKMKQSPNDDVIIPYEDAINTLLSINILFEKTSEDLKSVDVNDVINKSQEAIKKIEGFWNNRENIDKLLTFANKEESEETEEDISFNRVVRKQIRECNKAITALQRAYELTRDERHKRKFSHVSVVLYDLYSYCSLQLQIPRLKDPRWPEKGEDNKS